MVELLVLIILTSSSELNNKLRCCFFSLMAPLLVIGFLVLFVKKYINCIFCRFSLVVKLST